MTTILTLALDPAAQKQFEALRQKHYPPALNRIAAHLTLFHTLPADDATRAALAEAAQRQKAFLLQVGAVMSLGRGVAYALESPELRALHRDLAHTFAESLSPQDRQGFRPHIVVQNKVSGAVAKELKAVLEAQRTPWPVQAIGLQWWNYLGGPWELKEEFLFPSASATATAS